LLKSPPVARVLHQGTILQLAEKPARRESFVSGHDFSRAEKAAKIAGL
jgi:hypothetical protein